MKSEIEKAVYTFTGVGPMMEHRELMAQDNHEVDHMFVLDGLIHVLYYECLTPGENTERLLDKIQEQQDELTGLRAEMKVANDKMSSEYVRWNAIYTEKVNEMSFAASKATNDLEQLRGMNANQSKMITERDTRIANLTEEVIRLKPTPWTPTKEIQTGDKVIGMNGHHLVKGRARKCGSHFHVGKHVMMDNQLRHLDEELEAILEHVAKDATYKAQSLSVQDLILANKLLSTQLEESKKRAEALAQDESKNNRINEQANTINRLQGEVKLGTYDELLKANTALKQQVERLTRDGAEFEKTKKEYKELRNAYIELMTLILTGGKGK